jgi:HD superfamily phosphohydrolase
MRAGLFAVPIAPFKSVAGSVVSPFIGNRGECIQRNRLSEGVLSSRSVNYRMSKMTVAITSRSPRKLYQDEIYHDKVLSPLAVAVIDTAEFQRLEGMKQLAFTYLAFRGASHTRFSHSVGVYFATRTLLRRIVQNHERVSGESAKTEIARHPGLFLSEKFVLLPDGSGLETKTYKGNQGRWRGMTEVVSIAALLHDLGHVPFGHTLEDEFSGFFERHDSLVSHRVYTMLFHPDSELNEVFSTEKPRWLPGFTNRELQQLIFLILSFKEKVREDGYTSFASLLNSEIKHAEDLVRKQAEAQRRGQDRQGNRDARSADRGDTILLRDRLQELRRLYDAFAGDSGGYNSRIFHPFMSDAVSNTICADLLDYLMRDQRNLGIECHSHNRILRNFLVRPGTLDGEESALRLSILLCRPDKGGQRRDVATSILDIMRDRYHMVERALYHHKKCAASTMLAKLFDICPEQQRPRDGERIYPAPWTASGKPAKAGDQGSLAPHVVHLSDAEMIEYLGRQVDAGDSSELQRKLYLGLRYRKLYRTLLVVDTDLADECTNGRVFFPNRFRGLADDVEAGRAAQENRTQLERDLALVAYPGRADKYGSVLLYCPSNKMQAKEIDVRTELRPGIVRPLRTEQRQFSLSRDIDVLKIYYSELWRMYLFVEPEIYADSEKCLKLIEAFAQKCLIPDVLMALRKARKPELLAMYESKQIQPASPVQIAFETGPIELMAARSTDAVAELIPEDETATEVDSTVSPTDDELFPGVMPMLSKSSKGAKHLQVLQQFLQKRGLGSLALRIPHLRFINRTLEHFGYDPGKLLTEEMLERWFREDPRAQFGSKP